MQRQAGAKGDAIGNDTVAKLKEQYDKHLPPDDQDAFTPKKKKHSKNEVYPKSWRQFLEVHFFYV